MAENKAAVFGIYATRAALQSGLDALKEAGFRQTDISVLCPDESAGDKATKASEGAATGASTGAVVGGALGWLAGLGSLAIPGVGLLVAVGPVVAAIAGASAGGAVGGVAGGLVGLGMTSPDAENLQGRVHEGGMLLSVHSDKPHGMSRAQDILRRTGAQDIAVVGEPLAPPEAEEHPFPGTGHS